MNIDPQSAIPPHIQMAQLLEKRAAIIRKLFGIGRYGIPGAAVECEILAKLLREQKPLDTAHVR